MRNEMTIRETVEVDRKAIMALYPQAFPEEDLLSVVSKLLDMHHGEVSLVAVRDGEVCGHVVFTPCGVEGHDETVWLLAPLCVHPERQRVGIGKALIADGLLRADAARVAHVCVLGNPAYYSRSGFAQEIAIQPPYPMPEEMASAWQGQSVGLTGIHPSGRLLVPRIWADPALW